jgi:hypothetical protein
MRRYEAIVDAARGRQVEALNAPAQPQGLRIVGTLMATGLWWFWMYAVLHILLYIPVLGGPGLSFERTSVFVTQYLHSFDNAIAIAALITALVGSVVGWLPGSEPGLLRGKPSVRRTGLVIVRNVVIGKIITSVWAAVFVAPLEAYSSFGIVFAGTGLWVMVATAVALTANNIGRWFVVVALFLDIGAFVYLAVQLGSDALLAMPLVSVLALAGFMLATLTMLAYLLVSTRVNRFFGT